MNSYRSGPVERVGEFLARQHLGDCLKDVDRKIRNPFHLPLAWSKRKRIVPGLYRLWLGFEYEEDSSMAFKLEMLFRPFFAGTKPGDGSRWKPNRPSRWGEGLDLQKIEHCPYHMHWLDKGTKWPFQDADLSFPQLWQPLETAQLGSPHFEGEVVVERGVHPDYRRLLVRERSGTVTKRRITVLPFSTVTEYVAAYRKGKKLCR